MNVIQLTGSLDASADSVPSEFVLLKSGENEYEGGKLIFDAKAAESVMSRYQKRGIQLMADYEHQSLNTSLTGPIPAAAKKWTPEVRDGSLVASNIAWTPRAKQMLADGEYRYFSIACRVEPKTGRVSELINFALTNNPAANRIEPLVAASLAYADEPAKDNIMRNVVVALGLKVDAEEADALAAVTSLKDFERNALALSGKTNRGEALGVLTALAAKAEQSDKLAAELVSLKAAAVKAEVELLVDEAVKDGRVEPAKRAEMVALADAATVAGLKACLSLLPKKVLSAAESPAETSSGDVKTFSAMEIQFAKAFVGDDQAAIAARITEVRAAGVNPLAPKK